MEFQVGEAKLKTSDGIFTSVDGLFADFSVHFYIFFDNNTGSLMYFHYLCSTNYGVDRF